jgi:hypothetical protein
MIGVSPGRVGRIGAAAPIAGGGGPVVPANALTSKSGTPLTSKSGTILTKKAA